MKKLLIVAAGVAGYVLGSRAGRERYDQIRDSTRKVWNSPTVQSGVDHATDAAKSAAGAAGTAAAGAASTAGHKVVETVSDVVSRSDDADGTGSDDEEGDADVAPDADLSAAEADVEVPTSPAVTTPPTAADLAEDGPALR